MGTAAQLLKTLTLCLGPANLVDKAATYIKIMQYAALLIASANSKEQDHLGCSVMCNRWEIFTCEFGAKR